MKLDNDNTVIYKGRKEEISSDAYRALIVDDEPSVAMVFQLVLASEWPDLIIDVACNGKEAVESFEKYHQGIVLLDLFMPVMDGETAYMEIEKICIARCWEIPAVVFCTGYTPPQALHEVLKSPRHCLLAKPMTLESIVAAVRTRLPAAA